MTEASKQQLAALMFTDIVGSVALQNKLGTEAYTRFIRRHDEVFKECLGHAASGEILKETGDGFLVKFDTPTEAVNTALRLQAALHDEVCEGEELRLCIGLNLGAVTEMEEGVRGEKRAVGMAINLAARVMDLAEGGQILMTRSVFDDARQFVREHPQQSDLPESAQLVWPAHGRYVFKGNDDPLEIYEVGAEGMAPLSPPADSNKAKRAVAVDEEDTLGWRPGAGIPIPRMEDWIIERKIGEGGFGEVWLAKHLNTKEERVFKFCFDPERLRSFRRELTLFRLLRDALGKRDDIAAIYDVSIESPPFYLITEPLRGHSAWTMIGEFAEGGRTLRTLDLLGVACVWDLEGGSAGATPLSVKNTSNWFVGHDGNSVACRQGVEVLIHRLDDDGKVERIAGKGATITAMSFAKDRFMTQHPTSQLLRHDLKTGKEEALTLDHGYGAMFNRSTSADGSVVLTARRTDRRQSWFGH